MIREKLARILPQNQATSTYQTVESNKTNSPKPLPIILSVPRKIEPRTYTPAQIRELEMFIAPVSNKGVPDPTFEIFQLTSGMTTIGGVADELEVILQKGSPHLAQWLDGVNSKLEDLIRTGNIGSIITTSNTFLMQGNIIDGNHRSLCLARINDPNTTIEALELNYHPVWFYIINTLTTMIAMSHYPTETAILRKQRRRHNPIQTTL